LTLQQRLFAAKAELQASGLSEPESRIEVGLFARTILGWDQARLITESHADTPFALEPRFSEWIARRVRKEPSAYIVGVREFWGLDFHVTPAVLIPRPETEMVVEEVLKRVGPVSSDPPITPRIADIGTGSGCIAVSIAHDAPHARVVATDISGDAVAVARANAVRHGVDGRMAFVTTSYLDGIDGAFDIIAANPPYVRDGDKLGLSEDVRHEPDVALFGGPSGFRHIEAVLDTAVQTLRPQGWLIMEMGLGQEDDVRAIIARRPALRVEDMRSDLQGIPRTFVIQKTEET